MLRRSKRLVEKKEIAAAAKILMDLRKEEEDMPPAGIDVDRYVNGIITLKAILERFEAGETVEKRIEAVNFLMLFLLDDNGQYVMNMCAKIKLSIRQKIQGLLDAGIIGSTVGFNMGRVWQLYFV